MSYRFSSVLPFKLRQIFYSSHSALLTDKTTSNYNVNATNISNEDKILLISRKIILLNKCEKHKYYCRTYFKGYVFPFPGAIRT